MIDITRDSNKGLKPLVPYLSIIFLRYFICTKGLKK